MNIVEFWGDNMIDILAIGELLIDFTPVKNEEGVSFKQNAGGAPCNMLTMAQKLGSKTAFIGKVGNDQFGKFLERTLIDHDISTEGLILSDDFNTTLAFVHLTEDGDRSFSFYRKGCADVMLYKEDIDYKLVDQAKAVHFGSLSFTDEPSRSTVEDVIKYAKTEGKLISYDPNYRPALWASEKDAVESMKIGLKYADIIKVSEEEAEILTGEKDYKVAAKKLYDLGIKLVCVTLGVDGSYYHHKNGHRLVKGFKSKVIDTTGAGDSFFGSVIHGVLKNSLDTFTGEQLDDILSFSNAAASVCIEKLGGIPAIPNRDEIIKKMKI